MLRKPLVVAFLVSITTIFGGCSKSKNTADNQSESKPESNAKTDKDLNSVNAVPSEGQGLTSPAKQDLGTKFDPTMDPSTVTSTYLKSLKESISDAESLKTANELLTSKARNATHLANVDVSLPGSEKSDYVVHQAKYVTNEKNVAHVLTSWTDNIDDEKYKYDVTWVLKSEPNIGWRVSGMITSGDTPTDTVVFNFEDAADIVSKGGPESKDTQTAKKNGESEIR